jgi:hypothetical protein
MRAEWIPEELAQLATAYERCQRLCHARNAPQSTSETRVALVAYELRLSESDLKQFYHVRRKGAKKRWFNFEDFAKKYGVDIQWIWHGDLCGHPRLVRARS